MKNSRALSGINGLKRVARTWKIMEQVVVQDLTEPMTKKQLRAYKKA
jgi:hypothetical protein